MVDPAHTGDLMGFSAKIRYMSLDNEDKVSKSIKQLDLLSIMPGLNRNILKEATTRMMERIVRGESSSCGVRSRRRQPSRLPKKTRERRRSSILVEVNQGQNESAEREQ